ncbi:hypothetical protein FHT22_001138 [Pedobacter sp. SG918]|nr:hypothetical protein [Pedobacter sp. SG918]
MSTGMTLEVWGMGNSLVFWKAGAAALGFV